MSVYGLNPELTKSQTSVVDLNEALMNARLAIVEDIAELRVLAMQVNLPSTDNEETNEGLMK